MSEGDENDLSWVTFLDKNPRNDPECDNEICTAPPIWVLQFDFPCGHYPNVQKLCQRHKTIIEVFFEEDEAWATPVQCTKCQTPIQMIDIQPNKLGAHDE